MLHAPLLRKLADSLSIVAFAWLTIVIVSAQEPDPDETREASVVAKFVTVLEKNPRRGTALDKVYGFHVERGSLDGLIKTYRTRAEAGKGVESGSAWMIVGLLESLRGQDAISVEAFANAEKLDSSNYLASYYLGQALILVGQPDKAAEALERSIQRKPAQADQLDIFQALGRVYQRAHKAEKALGVWNRLEKQFPNDPRVQEQIAVTLLEENEFAAALPRFEGLAKSTKDKYRQSLFKMEAAEIQVRLGKTAEAINDFEKLLGQLNPDNWLFREVRRRIENVFLRTDDQSGLIAYYEAWTKKHPEDLEAVSRLARLLSGLGRGPEAQEWLLKGLKTAPSRKDLRNSLIQQLVYEQKFPEAIVQYEQLDKYEPNNPDTLREWGRIILKDTTRDEAVRKKDAAVVWRKLTTAKPKDPLIASQVAELFRQAEMVDEALAYYRQAIQLAPSDAQYKEYLGEYFHSLQRKDEALETWRQMAEGKAKTAANFARLSEVLAGFGYLTEAIANNAEACKLDPKEINLQIKQADLLSQAEKHEESLKQLAVVQKLASNDEEREAWLQRELKELQAVDQLKPRIATLTKELEDRPDHGKKGASDKEKQSLADKWFWLARAYEFDRQLKDAAEAVGNASELTPQSIPVLMSSARILESQNNLLAAVEANTKLAAIDRRYRTEYLKKVAQLEVQLGRREKAIQAGRDVLAAAPGNPELYEFFSQLCFQLGETDEGLQALRRSVRINPTDSKGLLLLASALGEQFRTVEAIELYWRAFDKGSNLDDRLGVIPKLTELYLQINQFDRILERLERQRREPNQQREMTICLAQAYQSAGDDGNARLELEKLLTEDSRDTQLLMQLVKLCESDGDLEAAIRFQQQVIKVAPGKDGIIRLSQLLMKSGDNEEATRLLTQVTLEEKDPEQLIKSIDSLLSQQRYEQVLGVTERIIRDQPRNWEVLYREGVALAATKPEEAARRFEAILALNLKDVELTLTAKNQAKKNQGRMGAALFVAPHNTSMFDRDQYVHYIRQAVGMDQDHGYMYGGQPLQPFWSPESFGTARMACLAWLNMFAMNSGTGEEFVKERRARFESSEDLRVITDWYYLALLRNDRFQQYVILKRLSRRPDADSEIKGMYLSLLSNRNVEQPARVMNGDDEEPDASVNPLDNEELEHVLNCYRQLGRVDEENLGESFLEVVVRELELAGREDEATKMLEDRIKSAETSGDIAILLSGFAERNDYDAAIKLLDQLSEMKPPANGATQNPNGNHQISEYAASPEFQAEIVSQLMANRASKNELRDVLSLWDRYLPLVISRYQAQRPTRAANRRGANFNPASNSIHVPVWSGGNQSYEEIEFPTPNDYYDLSSIGMLWQAHSVYKEAEKVQELLEHFEQKSKSEKTKASEKVFWKLGLGYLLWWEEEKDDALAILSEVTQSISDDDQMTFELARMYEKRGDPQQALAMIESIPATDQQMMQAREIAALRMSVNSGNVERARTAAERLFGLRLDSKLQILLARQMHQLGMHEQAEALLARAGRQAGNKTDVLMSLMQQYQSQGKNDVAVQIAHQLLRRTSSSAGQSTGRRSQANEDGNARQQAILVLKRSGKLPELTAKIESQLKQSPKSQKLLETLIEYYAADGNDKKVAELSLKIAESKSDDPKFRFQLAMQLVRQGKHKESLDHFQAALKKDPRLIRNSFWEIQQSFGNANKLDELAKIYEEIDLKSYRHSLHELTNLINNMSRRPNTKDQSIALFKKAWKELPEQRPSLLSNMHGDDFWKLPEIYDYARQGVIPNELTLQQAGRWSGLGNIQGFSDNGEITTLMNRLLEIAEQSKKLDELATEVTEARANFKSWEAGEPLLALIDLRRNKIDEAKQSLEKLLPTIKGQQQSQGNVHWEIAYELSKHEKCIDLAVKYLEAIPKILDANRHDDFDTSPGKLLTTLYKKQGRKDKARKLVLQASKVKRDDNYGDPTYEAYQRIQRSISFGNEFRLLGYPIDAVQVLQESMARGDDLVAARRYNDSKSRLEKSFQAALNELKPELLPELLGGNASSDAKEESSVDLVLMIDSREMDKTTLKSALVTLINGLTSKPEMLAKSKDLLAVVREKRSDDLSAMILAVEFAFTAKDTENINATTARLLEMVDQTPLPSPAAKRGFSTTEREMATRQIGLWFAARRCLKQEAMRTSGAKLGERALEASRRNADQGFSLAILREWGQISLESGDRETAEKRWREMLEIIFPKRTPRQKAEDRKTSFLWNDSECGKSFVENRSQQFFRPLHRWELMLAPVMIGQATPRSKSDTGGPTTAVNFEKFEQGAQVAKMAAENGMMELSLEAIALALAGGPPVVTIQEAVDPFTVGSSAMSSDDDEETSAGQQTIESRLAELERIWRKNRVSNDQIYGLLKSIVLPDSRPLEVFLYPRPLARNPNQNPQSVGLLLVQVANRAKKLDDLKAALEPRLKQPLGELAARVLATQMAINAKDFTGAKEHLEALDRRLKNDSLQHSAELVCHAAIPAKNQPTLKPLGFALLERAVDHFGQNAQQSRGRVQIEPTRTYRLLLSRFHFQQGNADAAKSNLKAYMAFAAPLIQRNSGGSTALQRRREELIRICAEFAQGGLLTDALEFLGQYADLNVPDKTPPDSIGRAGALVFSGLAALPAGEAFAVLKQWTLPTPERQSVRIVAGIVPADKAPLGFDAMRGKVPRGPREPHLASTYELLIAAAQSAGKLEELSAELKPYADKNVENAKTLFLMTLMALGDTANASDGLKAYLDERRKVVPHQRSRGKPPQLLDAVVAKIAMLDPQLRALGRDLANNFLTHCRHEDQGSLVAMIRRQLSASALGDELVSRLDHSPSQTGLKHWTAGATVSAKAEAAGVQPMWWLTHEGMVHHICGPDQSHLYFKYPLTGSFDVACDAWMGGSSEGNIGYGGVAILGLFGGSTIKIFPIGNPQRDVVNKFDPFAARDGFNRIKIAVRPGKISYFVAGSLVHEIQNTGFNVSPWFFLHCDKSHQSCFKNFEITGQPVIPGEVHLANGTSLLGWSTESYDETQPRMIANLAEDGQNRGANSEYDWQSKDGIIYGKALPISASGKNNSVRQSRLTYDRPLLDGEKLSYEFWYETGATNSLVHPAFDRLAFILAPDGVKMHWMTDGIAQQDIYSGLNPFNMLFNNKIQRGAVVLKEASWNSVEITLKQNIMTISLNGSVVCQRPLEPDNSRQFGLYHDKNATAVRVRNIVLTGDWPQTLSPEILANLLEQDRKPTTEECRAISSIIDEKFHFANVDSVLINTRKLSATDRYNALKNWVLPNDDHAMFRLYGAVSPADLPPPSPIVLLPANLSGNSKLPAPQPEKGREPIRQRTGGELIAPVLDLIAVAREIGKLDELRLEVQNQSDPMPIHQRSRLAMFALIEMARGDWKQAEARIAELVPILRAVPDDGVSIPQRWPELTTAWEALRYPALRKPAIALCDRLIDAQNRKAFGAEWEVLVRSVRHYAYAMNELNIELPSATATSPGGQWTQVPLTTKTSRSRGMISRWAFSSNEARHLGGEGNDLLYFQSPLQGKFTVEGELTNADWREIRLMYGAFWAIPRWDFSSIDLGNLTSSWEGTKIEPRIATPAKWYSMRVEVEPGKSTYFLMGKKVHEQTLPAEPDPWLAIHSWGHYGGSVRGLRISGQPTIPDSIKLSALGDLTGWLADQYGEWTGGDDPLWKKHENEIIGRSQPMQEGHAKQSVLQYHRPMLEDGEIAYEFFYLPEKSHVHPALDRLAFLLDPDGVKIHWLTDANLDRSGLSPDNMFVELQNRRSDKLPLKKNDWNSLRLAVNADTVTLVLNGQTVYERPLEPTNLRNFGLFRFIGNAESRVRNITFRGNWPKTLPPIELQDFAGESPVSQALRADEASTGISWNFQGHPKHPLRTTGLSDGSDHMPHSEGVRLVRKQMSEKHEAGYELTNATIKGDFELTLGYREFQSKSIPNKEEWNSPRVEILMGLGGEFGQPNHSHTISYYNRRTPDQKLQLSVVHGAQPNPEWKAKSVPHTAAEGQLRIVRRGSTVTFLHAGSGTDEWQLIDTRDVPPDDVKVLIFGIRAQRPEEEASCILTALSLRCQKFDYIPRLDSHASESFRWSLKDKRPDNVQELAERPSQIVSVPDGIKLSRPDDQQYLDRPIGFTWHGLVHGDFEVTLSYQDFQSTADQSQKQIPRIEVNVPIGAPVNSPSHTHTGTMGLKQRAEGKYAFYSEIETRLPNGSSQSAHRDFNTKQNTGRIRLVRLGTTMLAYFALPGSDTFVPIAKQPVGDGDVKSMSFTLRSEAKNSSASVVLTEISIRGEKVVAERQNKLESEK